MVLWVWWEPCPTVTPSLPQNKCHWHRRIHLSPEKRVGGRGRRPQGCECVGTHTHPQASAVCRGVCTGWPSLPEPVACSCPCLWGLWFLPRVGDDWPFSEVFKGHGYRFYKYFLLLRLMISFLRCFPAAVNRPCLIKVSNSPAPSPGGGTWSGPPPDSDSGARCDFLGPRGPVKVSGSVQSSCSEWGRSRHLNLWSTGLGVGTASV